MAQRRMFSKVITNSSNFLMMPQSSQNLYFHLGMNSDDDGFCEHFTVMRMTDSKPDDLKVLQAKGFVRVFDDKVLVILNWKENNYIQKDRYTPSKYLEIYKKELRLLTEPENAPCIQDGYKMDTQVRLGKVRIGKDREEREKKIYTTFSSFKKNKQTILKRCTCLYPSRNCTKALSDFIEYCEIHKTNYRNYGLAFFRWVREDKYNQYSSGPARSTIPSAEETLKIIGDNPKMNTYEQLKQKFKLKTID